MSVNELPNDSDGDAIRRVVRDGADLARPMSVDFSVAFASMENAQAFVRSLPEGEFETSIETGENGDSWCCYCTKVMILGYPEVVQIQKNLDELAGPLGGVADGWGTFGNCAE